MCNFSLRTQGAIDNTRVTCVKWVPSSETEFVSSHRSGHLYVWSVENTSKTTGIQNYVPHAEIQDAMIHTVKSKHKSPVLYRWSVGHGAINAFEFSPDLTHIAIASQDGFLRLYDFPKQQFYARMRSYYGGLLCVCWSPDGRYTVTGGEDDLITVWSFEHKRVVARGEGHKSYVNDVAFDPYTTCIPDRGFSASERHSICSGSDNGTVEPTATPTSSTLEASSAANGSCLSRTTSESVIERGQVAYRLGSVGQDTQLCLWDLSGDSLKLRKLFSRSKSRLSRHASRPQSMTDLTGSLPSEDKVGQKMEAATGDGAKSERESSANPLESEDSSKSNHTGITKEVSTSDRTEPSLAQNKSTSDSKASADTEKGAKESTASPESSIQSTGKESSKKLKKANKKAVKLQSQKGLKAPVKKVMKFVGNIGGGSHGYRRDGCGTFFETCNSHDIAPKMDEVNLIEPLVAKVISHERLTALVFRRDCIVTACQEGFVHTWARPDAKLPPEAAADYNTNTQSRPQTNSVSSNPGVRFVSCTNFLPHNTHLSTSSSPRLLIKVNLSTLPV